MKDSRAALDEAIDVYIYLKPMRRHFEELEESDFADLKEHLPPMFHCLCLVWSHCKHYQQPSRLVVLLQEITNLMLDLVSPYYNALYICIYLHNFFIFFYLNLALVSS